MNDAWVGVVSLSHVRRGVEGGFAQVNHGKRAPLERMQPGDWFVYYSPSLEMGGAPLRAFTALGRIADRPVYQGDMGCSFTPFRRDVAFVSTQQVAIADLDLELTRGNWGLIARRGHFPISQPDLRTIARAMGVSP